jgi:hypothetical protein
LGADLYAMATFKVKIVEAFEALLGTGCIVSIFTVTLFLKLTFADNGSTHVAVTYFTGDDSV